MMSESRPVQLDCRIKVRRYVLVAQPSRWNQRGERVVVQSPMLEIPRTVSHVPVKRYNGKEHNSVCFIPREDIERESSIVYERSQVNTAPSWVDAHGVALFDSSPSAPFKYRRGDKFWICIGSDTSKHEKTVPVINLQGSFEQGMIYIDQVCWYPKIQGPENELWTPGGELRSLKRSGPKNFDYFSWIICQRVPETSTSDGDLTPTTKTAMMPFNDIKVKDTRYLSPCECRDLFQKRLQLMEDSLRPAQYASQLCETGVEASPVSSLPTPPSSPELEHLRRRLDEVNNFRFQASSGLPNVARSEGLWSRILDSLPTYNGRYLNAGYLLRNSSIHPQPLPETRRNDDRRTGLKASGWHAREEENLLEHSLIASVAETISASDMTPSPQPSIPEPSEPDATLVGAKILLEIFKDVKERPAVSVTSLAVFPDAYSIHETWRKNKPQYNPVFDDLCDQDDTDCSYKILFRCRHFHPPPSKCRFSSIITSSGGGTYDQSITAHEHCIARLAPLPAGAGYCMLANIPSRNHTCCDWASADLDGKSVLHKRSYETGILDVHQRKKLRTQDRRDLIDGRLESGQNLCLRDCDGLDEEGMKLYREDLDAGVLEVELGRGVQFTDGRFEDLLCEELGMTPAFEVISPKPIKG